MKRLALSILVCAAVLMGAGEARALGYAPGAKAGFNHHQSVRLAFFDAWKRQAANVARHCRLMMGSGAVYSVKDKHISNSHEVSHGCIGLPIASKFVFVTFNSTCDWHTKGVVRENDSSRLLINASVFAPKISGFRDKVRVDFGSHIDAPKTVYTNVESWRFADVLNGDIDYETASAVLASKAPCIRHGYDLEPCSVLGGRQMAGGVQRLVNYTNSPAAYQERQGTRAGHDPLGVSVAPNSNLDLLVRMGLLIGLGAAGFGVCAWWGTRRDADFNRFQWAFGLSFLWVLLVFLATFGEPACRGLHGDCGAFLDGLLALAWPDASR